jgi:anti-sigma factor RsiW
MDCQEARELLEEFRRGELSSEAAARVAAHLAGCPACRRLREEADAMATLVGQLRREEMPPRLGRRIRRLARRGRGVRRPLGWLARPWVAAAVAAVLVAGVLGPWAYFRGARPEDPLERVLQSGIAEHSRLLLQLQAQTHEGRLVSDPAETFATVQALTNVTVPWVFAGDEELTLMEARPTVIASRKAAAVVLRDRSWFITTYFAMPGKDLPMPDKGRVQIDRYRPYMRQADGFSIVYWKQGEYAHLMISDLDPPRCQALFLKMRKGM